MSGARRPEAKTGRAGARMQRGAVDKRMLAVVALWLAVGLSAPLAGAAGMFPADGPSGLGGGAAADSLRTNLWLVEALMGEAVGEAAAALPPAPARVLLVTRKPGTDPQAELLRLVAVRVLTERGYELLGETPDSLRGRGPDVTAEFSANLVDLSYPDVGRTLGLWRRWVEREVEVVVTARLVEAGSGRLLLDRRLARRFSDRVTNDEFPLVNSKLYPFTTAAVGESGWQRRLEEFAVLGTLAGLVAVYFANTGD